MNDEEIKKALEQHIHIANYVDSIYCENVEVALLQRMLALIDKQQAEIERLNGNLFTISNACMQRRNEAIKEFAERLKMKAYLDNGLNGFLRSMVIDVNEIDNLLKEMVGEQNA